MKRRQFLMTALLVLITTAFVFTGCGMKTTVKTLESLSVNADNAKVEYFAGEEFDPNGIIVTARFQVANSTTDKDIALNSSEYTVDSSAFNTNQVGKYDIIISYTYEEVTKTATYQVTVTKGAYDGLAIELGEGMQEEYLLTQATATIDTTKIIVKETNALGDLIDQPISGYTTALYQGKDQIQLTDGVANVTAGVYQIWVYSPSKMEQDYIRKAFVTIYVLDRVETLAFNEGTLTQPAGSDEITATWTFIVTYKSGATKQVTASDLNFVQKVDTSAEGENLVATVNYEEKDLKGETYTTPNLEVNYTVTKKQSTATVTNEYNFSLDALIAEIEKDTGVSPAANKTALKDSYFTGVNSFITFIGTGASSDQYRTDSKGCFEIKAAVLQVTFEGTGTLSFSVASTGGNNKSRFALKDAKDNYLTATSYEGATKVEGDEEGSYEVAGTTFVTLSYEIKEPGTYSIVSVYKTTGRGGRIKTISMVDTIVGEDEGEGEDEKLVPEYIYGVSGDITADMATNTATTADYVWYSSENVIATILTNSKIKSTSNVLSINGKDVQATIGVNTAGAVTTSKKAIKLQLSKATKITVYYVLGGTSARSLVLSNGTENLYTGESYSNDTATVREDVINNLSAGTYYLGANTGGMTILCIVIEYI